MRVRRRPARLARTSPDWPALAALAGAAALAAGEMLLAIHAGGFERWGRAEALLFLAFRPWLLVLAALIAARWPWRRRASFYALFLAAAGVGESVYLQALGASDPWSGMLRGWIGGAALLVPVDLLLQAGGRWDRRGRAAAAAAAAALLLVPGVLRPYRALALGAEARPQATVKPELRLMTALPIVWGEGGAFDPNSRPAGIYRALQEEFTVRPIDTLDSRSLGGSRLLLLAQPRWLAPAELAELDSWVRGGGRVLILTDPDLDWPTALPLGDIRRPPAAGLLEPLLRHWGLGLEPTGLRERLHRYYDERRAAIFSPGRFAARGGDCTVPRADIARCRLGAGRALLLADADLMRDDLWMAEGPDGGDRHRRTADNPLVVADYLDELAGIERERVRAPVAWRAPGADVRRAELSVVLPLLGLAAGALLLRLARKR